MPLANVWSEALQHKNFKVKLISSGMLLLLCAVIAPYVFQYVQQRQGFQIHDHILTLLPAIDLSHVTFILLYFLILTGVVVLLHFPGLFLLALQGYVLLTIIRFITILLVPLEPPQNIIVLTDPFVERFFYQQTITKDLFFSGHTSILVLLGLVVPSKRLSVFLFAGAFSIGCLLLLQHAHYTIDVLAAPFFSWIAIHIVRKYSGDNTNR